MSKLSFTTTIFQQGNNTGIEVPEAIISKLDSGKKPAVVIAVNGFSYRSTVAVMGGKFLIPLSAERRKSAKVNGGEQHKVTIELDTLPREVTLHPEFKLALDKNTKAQKAFEKLSFSARQALALPIEQAKAEDTRKRRIEKALQDLESAAK